MAVREAVVGIMYMMMTTMMIITMVLIISEVMVKITITEVMGWTIITAAT